MKPVYSVLIVDDDDDDRDMFCEAVGQVSATTKCFHAANGLEALSMLSGNPDVLPDLIFLDLNMPRLNGKDCLLALKKIKGIDHIPVIIYSTSNLKEDREETKKLGAAAYLHKPTNFETLCKELSAVLVA